MASARSSGQAAITPQGGTQLTTNHFHGLITMLTSLLTAGGEADATGLLCFAGLVYQPAPLLSTLFSRKFYDFSGKFLHIGDEDRSN